VIQSAIRTLLDGHDLLTLAGARGDGRDHGRGGDTWTDRWLPRGAPSKRGDSGQDRRLRRRGARSELSPALAPLVQRARALTEVPLYAGFGISTPEQASAVGALADGVVIGSAALLAAEDGPAALERFVGQLRAALV
jgi:Tryptophan synthase alpha chain